MVLNMVGARLEDTVMVSKEVEEIKVDERSELYRFSVSMGHAIELFKEKFDEVMQALQKKETLLWHQEEFLKQRHQDAQDREAKIAARENAIDNIRTELARARAAVADRVTELAKMQAQVDAAKLERNAAREVLGRINSAFPGLLDGLEKKK